MEIFGLGIGSFRFGLFVLIFVIMAIVETMLPRRERRFPRSQRWTVNLGMMLADFLAVSAVVVLVPVAAITMALWVQSNGWGILNNVNLPIWLEWLIAIVVLDWVIWAQHLATHKFPILWRIHRVHHSDVEMDASTAIRFHPVEIVFSLFVKALAVILLGPAALAVVVFEALVNGSALFNHSNFKLPLGIDNIVRKIFVTPDMHRVHHSVHPNETDSNYGFFLSIWDQIFGTYIAQPKDGHDNMVVGLNEWQDAAPTKLSWAMLLPFSNPPHTKNKD